MKSTGIVRKMDELGRIVIPKEIRRTFDIKEDEDSLEIFVDDNKIILKKYQPSCLFCNNVSDVITFKGKNICPRCMKSMRVLLEGLEEC